MNYLVFADGTKLPCKRVEEGPLFFDGQQRRALTVHIDAQDTGFDALDALLADSAKTARLVHLNDAVPTTRPVLDENGEATGMVEEVTGEARDIFDDYTLRVELAKRPVSLPDESGEAATLDAFVAVLAKKTNTEKQLDAMLAALVRAGLM